MSAPPTIPQRPARSQVPAPQAAEQPSGSTSTHLEPPKIPPRPAGRADRSISPHAFNRSPLNELPLSKPPAQGDSSSHGSPPLGRKPSVAVLPGPGEEGYEYANMNYASSQDQSGSPTHTRNVAGDLPMHAPKAGLTNTHQSSVAALTRTDSESAAAVGLGKTQTEYHDGGKSMPPPSKRNSGTAFSPKPPGSRPDSMYESDNEHHHGIPHIGPYVPMYPDAGDVQAPSPAPFSPQPTGVGFYNDASQGGAHNRRRSAHMHLPPDSYGLHGHGVGPHNQFEQAWYSKHPEERAKEIQGAYGPTLTPRGEYSMSSDDLNKLVRATSNTAENFGTNPKSIAIPPDAVGYQASLEYASRLSSPRPQSIQKGRTQSLGQVHAESPLHRASVPSELQDDLEQDENVIHIDPPAHNNSKYHSGGYDPPKDDLGPQGGNTAQLGGWIHEEGRGTPILASDEISKNPAAEYMQPAISPELERAGDGDYMGGMDSQHNPAYQSGYRDRSRSRPRSRPTSFHEPHGLQRWASFGIEGTGTPLENVEEYEPLFKDDDKDAKPLTAADRFKRPELDGRRFPSQDIWEDTPDSMMLSSTVTREQEPEDKEASSASSASRAPVSTFETPEQEAKRKGEITEAERPSYLMDPDKGFAKPKFSAGVSSEMTRPGMRHRFPSQDIWEDTPDSLRLETTVDPAEQVPSAEVKSPVTGQGVPAQNDLAKSFGAIDPALAAPFDKSQQPNVPARPTRAEAELPVQLQPTVPQRPHKVDDVAPEHIPDLPKQQTQENVQTTKQAPHIPERPKPQVPARPAKAHPPAQGSEAAAPAEQSREAPAATEQDREAAAPATTKQKPSVPSKIASLKANFMDQLNNRLALGPQAPPKPQPAPEVEGQEEEKAPLSDARRGRAKGPARRKPAGETETTTQAPASGTRSFSMLEPMHNWSIDPEVPHDVKVGKNVSSSEAAQGADVQGQQSAGIASIASQTLDAPGESTHEATQSMSQQTMAAVPPHTSAGEETLESKNDHSLASKPLLADQTTQDEGKDSGVADKAVQTGRLDLESMGEKVTAYEDGAAHPAGTVVLKEGEESVI